MSVRTLSNKKQTVSTQQLIPSGYHKMGVMQDWLGLALFTKDLENVFFLNRQSLS